jgi:hypothetical protein
VLHIDEAQMLMGQLVLTRNDPVADDLFEYAMPAVCDLLNHHASQNPWLRVILTGTNFFAPLVLNVGSSMKKEIPHFVGRFEPAFVDGLLRRYFKLGNAPAVVDLCANRRAIEHLLVGLQSRLKNIFEDDRARADDALEEAAKEAFHKWSEPVRAQLPKSSTVAVTAFAYLLFPESAQGRIGWKQCGELWLQVVRFPTGSLPQSIKDFALAGGLNLWQSEAELTLEQPTGCLRTFLLSLCKDALRKENQKELEAFRIVAQSSQVGGKGHVFERAVACELTLAGSKLCDVVAEKFSHLGPFSTNPALIGVPFVYEAKILQADWRHPKLLNRVLCVMEDPQCPGQRLVDLGFSMIAGKTSWRVLCELKDEKDQNTLWRHCYQFFNILQNHGDFHETDVAVFVSMQPFTAHQPQQRKVKKGLSAFDSRTRVLELISAKDSRFAIVEAGDWDGKTVLPLTTLASSETTSLAEVSSLEVGVHGMYVSPSPSKPQDAAEGKMHSD